MRTHICVLGNILAAYSKIAQDQTYICANKEDSGETAQMRSLTRVFVVRICAKYHFVSLTSIVCFMVKLYKQDVYKAKDCDTDKIPTDRNEKLKSLVVSEIISLKRETLYLLVFDYLDVFLEIRSRNYFQ